MSVTNFGLLTEEQKTIWSMDLWRAARQTSFVNKFMSSSPNSIIQRITELKRSEKGARAVITLIAELEGDGVVGDNMLEGNEESLKTFDRVITIDQVRHANRNEGKMADQRSIVEFRNNSKNALSYWLADRLDELTFLTMSGVGYNMKSNGSTRRANSQFRNLDFAHSVAPLTDKRRFRWDHTTKSLVADASTSDVTKLDVPTWQLFVDMKAKMKDHFMRPVRAGGGRETYHVFLTPQAMARLKMDADYMANLRHAQTRADANPLFTGTSVEIDGLVIHEFRHVFNTSGAPEGQRWGSDGSVEGCQILFCGAQALGFADIGNPEWNEKTFDYGNSQGIAVSKVLGMLKPQFNCQYAGNTVQDFGIASVYVSQQNH